MRNLLDLRARAAVTHGKSAPLLFASTDLTRLYIPSRGIPYSVLIHGIVFTVLVVLSASRGPSALFSPRDQAARLRESSEMRVVMILPLLGGGSHGGGPQAGRMIAPAKGPSKAPARASKGMSYPGPQRIISDPPDATNRIQTILQPALKKPPILIPLVPLPNIVQVAEAGPAAQPEPPKPLIAPPPPPEPQAEPKPAAPVLPPLELRSPTPLDEPKLVLPASGLRDTVMPETKPPEPLDAAQDSLLKDVKSDQPVPRPAEEPRVEPLPRTSESLKESRGLETSALPSHGTDLRTILALSPMPARREQAFEIPAGEARGRFAISPEPDFDSSETEPGSKIEAPPGPPGLGSSTKAPGGDAAAGNAAAGAAVTIGTSAGAGKGGGSAIGGTGSGSGTGSGTGSGRGSGTGAGSGPGKGPFAGITIVGGVGDTGVAANPAAAAPAPVRTARPLQSAYGVTIISTENSGGGLPSLGIFSNEHIYTVYLDMRKTETDTAPSWTLEFAVSQGADAQGSANPGRVQQGLVLPFPVHKEHPALPVEVVRKYLRRMMIVYAVINTDGKMEQIAVKESPDPLLNEPLLSALSKWSFRPARINGVPAPARVLLGIPLWLPQ